MSRATGDPRVRKLPSHTALATETARALLCDAFPTNTVRSRMLSENVARTEFRWDLRHGDPTPSDLDAARRTIRASAGYVSDDIGPWGGQVTRCVA